MTLEELNPSSFFDDSISNRLRAWLFVSFLLSFGAITASVWLMVAVSYSTREQTKRGKGKGRVKQDAAR